MNSIKLVLFSLIAGIMLSACGAPRYFIDEDWKGKPQPKNVKVVFTMPKVVVPIMKWATIATLSSTSTIPWWLLTAT